MNHNSCQPNITADAERYRVEADGVHWVCEPAQALPLAQRYMLF